MNFRELNMRTFQRKEIDRVLWQPRIRYWYNGNQVQKRRGEIKGKIPYPDVPDRYRGRAPLEVYDMLDASPRYPGEILGISVFRTRRNPAAGITETVHQRGEARVTVTETPVGELRTVSKGGYPSEFPVKTPDDCKVMEYVIQNTVFEFDPGAFEKADALFGERGVIQSFYPRSPFQALIVRYMGARNTFIQLHRNPDAIEGLMEAIDLWEDGMYDVLADCPVQILNFGENIDANLASPRYFKRYLVPFYQKRVDQLHRAGKFCHIHIDGAIRPLLPFLDLTDFDGIEAATPKPQGDVTLEELKEGLGDKILLDGIPAVLFIPVYTKKTLGDFTRKIIDMFFPNLILGVSDELPPTADIGMVEHVSKIVAES
jgi:hypothetical protein